MEKLSYLYQNGVLTVFRKNEVVYCSVLEEELLEDELLELEEEGYKLQKQ
jgi:hypothetical protein